MTTNDFYSYSFLLDLTDKELLLLKKEILEELTQVNIKLILINLSLKEHKKILAYRANYFSETT